MKEVLRGKYTALSPSLKMLKDLLATQQHYLKALKQKKQAYLREVDDRK